MATLSLSGTSLNDLFSDSVARIRKPWSPDNVIEQKDVTFFAQQLARILTSDEPVAISITDTSLYDLFGAQLAILRDRVWDRSPGGLQEFSEALVAAFSSNRSIGISATSTSLYDLFRSVISLLRSRSWSPDVRPFANELANLLSSETAISVTA